METQMFRIEGYESERAMTPVREGDHIKELIPGRERSYLRLRLLGQAFRLRVPFCVIQLAC